jgi:hypothetical protein
MNFLLFNFGPYVLLVTAKSAAVDGRRASREPQTGVQLHKVDNLFVLKQEILLTVSGNWHSVRNQLSEIS